MNLKLISPQVLHAMLADGGELALIDVREELIFSRAHLFFARSIPLSRLELNFARLVPRRSTRIVLCDEDDGLAQRAARVLFAAGYSDVGVLQHGIRGWSDAGFQVFSGVNVPSKAFGEFIEHADATPSIAADELDRMIRDGDDVVVLDSRPFEEYQRVSIPTAIDVPGAELVLHIRDLAPSPVTTVVVNCAGRTRSIIGAQSLINAGLPNKVVALRNGTMGWSLAGRACETGQSRRAPCVSAESMAWAKSAAERVAQRFKISRIDQATLDNFRAETNRTVYLFDVRDPAEYEAGHIPGALSAPGGQLVQATDQYVGTLGARIVLVDDAEVRAVMTASWLRQMGWKDVFVLAEQGSEKGYPPPELLGSPPAELRIDCAALATLKSRDQTTIVDVSLSREYLKAHIPGAWFAIRSRVAPKLGHTIALKGTLVFTSEDGILGGFAARDAAEYMPAPLRYLEGGNAAWKKAGHDLTSKQALMADEPDDTWLKPYERPGDATKAMQEYLAWEVDLLERIKQDGTARFAQFPAA
jgi:rhodanese-related sulfurtransferase